MKSNRTHLVIPKHLLRCVTVAVIALFCGSTGSAQGFFKRYFQGHTGSHIAFTAGGYRVWSYRNTILDPNTYMLLTDLNGNPTDTLSFVEAGVDFRTWSPDGNYIEVASDTILRKRDLSGNILWEVAPVSFDSNTPVVADDGAVFFYGDNPGANNSTDFYITKYSPDGALLWEYTGTAPASTELDFLVPCPDGGVLALTYTDQPPPIVVDRMLKVDAGGTLVFDVPRAASLPVKDLILWQQGADGNILVYGYGEGAAPKEEILEIWNAGGQFVRALSLDAVVPQPSGNVTLDFTYTQMANGDIVFAGDYQVPFGNRRNFLLRMDSTGQLRWIRYLDELGLPANLLSIAHIVESPEGDLLMTGQQLLGQSTPNSALHWIFWKTSGEGQYLPNNIGGLLAKDENVDCLAAAAEPPLAGWVLQVEDSGQNTYYTQSTPDGRYTIPAAPGTYTIRCEAPNYLWEPCDPEQNVVVPPDTVNFTAEADFPFEALAECPLLSVRLGAPFLHFCDSTEVFVFYCNSGSSTAVDATLDLELGATVDFAGSAQPHTQSGQTVTFQLGDVAPGDCGQFVVRVIPGCDSTVIEQTLCLAAHIYPDSICDTPNALWSGGGIEVRGECAGDSVRFWVKNIGHAPTSELDFIIADDHVVMYQGAIPPLDPGTTRGYAAPADGKTWRFAAEQEPYFPGAPAPSVAVEGCAGSGGPFSTGYVTQFPNSSGNPFEDALCRRFFLFPDSTVLSASPQGVGAQHLIAANTPIEYLVYFVNQSDSAVSSVAITDVLPAELDPATVDPGAAWAPYTWSVSGAGVLHIQHVRALGPGQSGFVQFKVDQLSGNAPGTVIENQAQVQLGTHTPLPTNTVWHTVSPQTLFPLSAPSAGVPVSDLQIFPNPARGTVFADNPGAGAVRLRLTDVFGKTVLEKTAAGALLPLERKNLPAGIYFVEQWEQGRLRAVGRLVWQ